MPPLIVGLLLLTACGQQAAVVPTQAPPATQAAAVPTQAPPATQAPADDLAGIPQGRTAEGYQALGAANAPVTLVMYSDFF